MDEDEINYLLVKIKALEEDLLFQQERCFVAGYFRANKADENVTRAWREYKRTVLGA
jgi:hypothetical protein